MEDTTKNGYDNKVTYFLMFVKLYVKLNERNNIKKIFPSIVKNKNSLYN